MIHWSWKGIALSPGSNSTDEYDSGGCWTGSAVIDITGNQNAAILYTGVRGPSNYESQILAFASDSSITNWKRYSNNPVIDGPPVNELNGTVSGFRDPAFWYDSSISKWRLFIGSGIENQGGCILQYTSDVLEGPWTFIKPLIMGNYEEHGDMWECPDLFELSTIDGNNSRWVLIFGDDDKQRNFYMIGEFDTNENIFIPDKDFIHGRILDAGNFYASKTMFDTNTQERILWGWSPEDRNVAAYNASGWAGIQTLPSILRLSNDFKSLVFKPVPEFSSIIIPSR